MSFQIGDKVKCINAGNIAPDNAPITQGSIYTIKRVFPSKNGNAVELNEIGGSFHEARFELCDASVGKTPHELVCEFNRTFGVHREASPKVPAMHIQVLRERLISEELDEFAVAGDEDNLVGCLDALCDLIYVVYAAADVYGFSPDLLDAAFREVHRSNMSKLWDKDAAIKHVFITSDLMTDAGNGKVIVKRADGKVIKPPTYSPADLKSILEGFRK